MRGEWIVPVAASPLPGVVSVRDDSRHSEPGCLFVAIRGERVDGHAYLSQALEAGAGALCVGETPAADLTERCRRNGIPICLVEDTLAAFQALALAHRRRFRDLILVGITGSCGKTSTKEMIAAILRRAFPGGVLQTLGNTNNHFGVPRNLLRLTAAHRAAIIEMGSNHPGEIAVLAAMAEPNVGVVSNIGAAHLEFFRDLAGVAAEKGDLLALTAPRGTVIYPAEAPHRDILARKAGDHRTLTFGTGMEGDVRVTYEGMVDGTARVHFRWPSLACERRLCWHIGGAHQALNAAAAASVGLALNLDPDLVMAGLAEVELPAMRMDVRRTPADIYWVNDAYNANPESMIAGIEWFAELAADAPPDRRILVLGDMLELGPDEATVHHRLLRWVRTRLPQAVVLAVGPRMRAAAEDLDLPGYRDADACRSGLDEHLQPGAWVFLKASRGMRLESLLPATAEPVS